MICMNFYSRVSNNRANTLLLILKKSTQHAIIRRKHDLRCEAPRQGIFQKKYLKLSQRNHVQQYQLQMIDFDYLVNVQYDQIEHLTTFIE